jgi:hypothetical protein
MVKNLHLIAEQIHKRSLVIIFTDFFENTNEDGLEEIFSALQHLKYLKNEVIIFNVLEQKHEVNFDFENRPYHFIDVETEESIKLNPVQYQKAYQEKIKLFKKELESKCGQLKIDLIDVALEDGFEAVLNAWLIKKNRMS